MGSSICGIKLAYNEEFRIYLDDDSVMIIRKGKKAFPLRFRIFCDDYKGIDAVIVGKDDKLEILHSPKEYENSAEMVILPVRD